MLKLGYFFIKKLQTIAILRNEFLFVLKLLKQITKKMLK